MSTPIDAVPVPVATVVRPEFWIVATPRPGHNLKRCLGWFFEDFNTKGAAKQYAADHPGSFIFRLPGSAAND